MRIKFFTLLFLMGIFGLTSFQAQAQQDSTIDPSEIRFWVGEGENQAILAVNWNEPDTCLAWGFRFGNDPVTVKEMMYFISEADPRFSFSAPESFVNDINYVEGDLSLGITEYGYFMYSVNGVMAMEYFDTQVVINGDLVKWGDTNCGTMIDPDNWVYVWEAPIVPVYPIAYEAMIDPSEIVTWIGEGDHTMVFAVNWAEPDTCFAWGYRFSADEIVLVEVMDAIAAADSRFAYEGAGGYLTDITFDAGILHLALVGDYWWCNVNGYGAWYGYDQQTIHDGDFVKWGDVSCATETAQWTYVWESPVVPVTNSTSVTEHATFVSLYPNPASSYVMLSLQNMGSMATVTVADLQGRVLNNQKVAATTEPVRIETEGLASAVYFVTVNDGVNCQTVKLTVK